MVDLLKEIRDHKDFKILKERISVRGLFFDQDGVMPIQYVQKHDIHKFPGGGLKEWETLIEGLKRELIEETGCDIEVTGDVGKIVEYRSEYGLKQTSYCYIGKVLSKGKILNLTKKEIAQGVSLLWVTFDQALKLMENDVSKTYAGKFIHERELTFALKAKELLYK